MEITAPAYDPAGNQPRPYVQFEVRPVENRAASTERGEPVWEDKVWAIVMAPGSRDSVEQLASEWIAKLQRQADAGRIPASWPQEYSRALQQFEETNTQPTNGTSLKNWPAISPGMLKNCLAANIASVEDLASANDSALSRIGMGSVALREMARSWIKERESGGSLLRQVETLTVRVQELSEQLAAALEENKKLASTVTAAAAKK